MKSGRRSAPPPGDLCCDGTVASLLRIDASPNPAGVSRRLTQAFTDAWQAANPAGTVDHLDLVADPVAHLGAAELAVWYFPDAALNAEQAAVLAPANALIDRLLAADELVVGCPMWNFSVPSTVKAWIDSVVRAGRTVGFGANGIEGLVPATRAVVFCSAGSDYAGPQAIMDHQRPYLRQILEFMGVDTVVEVDATRQGPNFPDGAERNTAALALAAELGSTPPAPAAV